MKQGCIKPTHLRLHTMQVRLTGGSAEWACTIKLRREWDDKEGKESGSVNEAHFGPTLTKKSDVEMAVRRAQKAVLNPGRPAAEFLTWEPPQDTAADTNEFIFTRNLVRALLHRHAHSAQ